MSGSSAAIRRLLVPTDLSPLGNRGVPLAYALLPAGGVVRLLYVIPPLPVPDPLYAHDTPAGAPLPEDRDKECDEISRALRALVPETAAASGIETQIAVVESPDVSEVICAEAESWRADLICMGSHGRSALFEALVGSVTQGVLAGSSRPVLIAPRARP